MDQNERERINFIKSYVNAINNGNAALFAGAGLSIPSGGLSWSELLKDEAESIGIDVSKENDLISVAQYIYNESGTKQTITTLLKNKINRDGKVNENHKVICDLPISKIWTTNYDDYIEKSFIEVGKGHDVKRSIEDMASEIDNSEVTIYKMHGDIGIPSSTVLLKDDYEIYDKKNEIFLKTLQADLINSTFLFIGFSFDDPNLESILFKVRIMLSDHPRKHYCILKKVTFNDPEIQLLEKENRENEFKYRENKQRLRVADLLRYGIKVNLVDDYNEITTLLKDIQRYYYSNKVFISGSYERVDKFLGAEGDDAQELADSFCTKLGRALFKEGYEISSGFGLGVGRNIITGYLAEESKTGKYRLGNGLTILPFEIGMSNDEKKEFRKKILKESGVAIFLFGNKKNDQEELVLADGVIEEYSISIEKELLTIPIGLTGYAAQTIWKEQEKDKELMRYYLSNKELSEKYNKLNADKNIEIDELINSIIFILNSQKK